MKNLYYRTIPAFTLFLFTFLFGLTANTFSQSQDSKGTEFWLTFPGNYAYGTSSAFFYITSEVNTSGEVSIPGLGFVMPFSVAAGTVTTISLPTSVFLTSSGAILNNGIHVTSLQDVTVYSLNRQQFTTDAYLALPKDVLGTEYINLGYSALIASQIGIVATENNTTITITPTATTDGHLAGTPINVVLNQGQTYFLKNYYNDLSGSVIISDKPVAVFGGNDCTNVPLNASACDHLVEQLPPTSSWGKNFVTVPLKTRLFGDTFRFIASTNGTSISVNGSVVANLNRGQFFETILAVRSQIISSEPILVAQFSNGSSYDGVTSDPFMMLITPYEQFLNSYTITTPATGFAQNFVNVVAPAAAIGNVRLDGVVIDPALFLPIGSSGFSGAQVNLSLGSHTLNGTTLPFGVFVYGFDSYDSYGYPGGQSFSPIAIVSTLALTPETGSAAINTEQCFDALVKDQSDNPLEGIRVDFGITGPNSASSGFAYTDASGIARFCYTGANEGSDNITASVGTLTDGASFTWTNTCYVTVSAKKFYDLNTDGIDNDNMPVEGWSITLSGTDENSVTVGPITQATNSSGTTSFTGIAAGSYTVSEGTQVNWIHTTSTSANLTIAGCIDPTQVSFGNVCIGAGTSSPGSFALGYWSNKNGLSMITGSYLCQLNALCLRTAAGGNFDPVTGCPAPTNSQVNSGKTSLKNWLQDATATNMAYMLSAHLAAMKLNVLKGYVDANKLIYAPGTTSANTAGFATINTVMTEANDLLCANGVIDVTHSLRADAEAVKNALEKANINQNFVQSQPCILLRPVVTTMGRINQEQVSNTESLEVKVLPNPSRSFFTLKTKSSSNQPVSLRIFDALGRVIESRNGQPANSLVQIGHQFRPGLYYAEVIQGQQKQIVKLMKGSE
jgi:hypothetical protein